MRLYFIVLAYTLFFLPACSKSDPDILLVLEHVEGILIDDPKGALSILEDINKEDIRGREAEARYALDMSEALDRNYIDVDNDSLIRIAHSYYLRSKDIRRKAKSSYYLGLVQFDAGNYEDATVSFLNALEYAQDLQDHYLTGQTHLQLGLIYECQESFDGMIEHYAEAINEFKQTELVSHLVHSLNVLGTAYEFIGEYETAIEYKKSGLNLATEIKDTASIIRISQEIGGTYHLLEDYDKAQEYLLDMFSRFDEGFAYDDFPGKFMLAVNYIKIGALDKARQYFESLDISELSDDRKAGVDYELYELEKLSGNYKKALAHFEECFAIRDSLWEAIQGEDILEIERKYENTQLEYENYKQRTYKWFFIIGMLVLIRALYAIHKSLSVFYPNSHLVQEQLWFCLCCNLLPGPIISGKCCV